MRGAYVYAFRGRVAVNLPGMGRTNYLTPAETKALAKAMRQIAKEVAAGNWPEPADVDLSDPFNCRP